MMTVQVRIILMMMVMMIVIVMVMMMVGRRNEVGVRRTVTIPRLLRARAAKSRPALAPLSFHFLALAPLLKKCPPPPLVLTREMPLKEDFCICHLVRFWNQSRRQVMGYLRP